MACASMVAVVVPSPATSEVFEATSRTICAPMFSSASRSSISLATVTPSWGSVGERNFFAPDEALFAVELDLGAGVLAEEAGVASFAVEREDLALVIRLALADGDAFALLR